MTEYARTALSILQHEAGTFHINIRGHCMTPLLHDGDTVLVRPKAFYLPGDVLIFFNGEGQSLAHRFLGYVVTPFRIQFLTMPLNATRPDGLFTASQIHGAVERVNGRSIRSVMPRGARWAAARLHLTWYARLIARKLKRLALRQA